MSARTVTGETGVWLTQYDQSIGPKELAEKDGAWLVKHVAYSSGNMGTQGWTRIGSASITITFDESKDIVTNKVAALQVEKRTVLADAQKKATDIERQIQTLLAITHEVQA